MQDILTLVNMIKRLNWIMNKKQKRIFLLLFVFVFIGSLLELLCVTIIMPLIYAIITPEKLLDNQITGAVLSKLHLVEKNQIIFAICFAIIVLYLFKNGFLIFSLRLQIVFRAKFKKDLSTRMLETYMKRPYSYFVNTNTGVLLRGVGTAVDGVYEILDNLSRFVSEMLTVLAIGGFIIIVDPIMAIGVLFFAGLCFLLVTIYFKRRISILGKKQWDTLSLTNKYAIQALGGYKEIKVRQVSSYFVKKYSEASEITKNATIENNFINILPERIIETVCITGIISVVYIRLLMNVDVTEFVPQLAAFAVAAFRILPSISRMSGQINNMVYWRPCLDETYNNIKEVKDCEASLVGIDEKEKQNDSLHFDDYISIEQISWKYDTGSPNVLNGLSMHINKGESVGIMGTSGAGKTTLTDILLGLMKPQEGSITVDGMDIYSSPKAWADLVGYVPQTTYLIDDTLKNNVAFGVDESQIDEDRVWRALEQAQLKDFVQALPGNLHHVLGEGGVRLSGGQRQRIAIARTLYFEPDIIVLDEATSALDNETEKAVMESIEYLQGKKTMIIVAHRLNTIKKCDKIYEIRDGKAYLRNKNEIYS